MNSLHKKPLVYFSLYSLLILLCSIPVYYLAVDHLWTEEIDENNQIVKENIAIWIKTCNPTQEMLDSMNATWQVLMPGTVAYIDSIEKKDRVYTTQKSIEPNEPDETETYRGLTSQIKNHQTRYTIIVESNIEKSDDAMQVIALIGILIFAVLVTGLILLNRSISNKLWRPFGQMLRKTAAYDIDEGKPLRLNETNIKEFNQLKTTIENLTQRNLNSYNRQKEFIENASHELQTPLALLKTKIDLELQNSALIEQTFKSLNELMPAINRLSHINKNLLLTARIENGQFIEKESVAMQEVIANTLSLFSDFIQSKQLKLDFHIAGKSDLRANRFLAETLVNNLLSNAFKYSPAGSEVSIALQNQTLQVKNKGETALNGQNIFDRFSRNNAQHAGTGLGLAICRSICRQHQWQITYEFTNGYHIFKVNFKNSDFLQNQVSTLNH